MRISALKYLIYRDLYLAKKTLLIYGGLALFMMFFGILVSLSTKCGNLALVPENYQNMLGEMLLMFSSLLPAYMCVCVGISVVETMQFETDKKWRRFRLSMPINGYMFALARYIVILGAALVCMVIAFAYMWGNSVILRKALSTQSIAVMLAITFILLIFGFLMQILIQLLGKADRAGLAMLVVLSILMTPVMVNSEVVAGAGTQFLFELCETYLPYIFAVFVVFLVISFVVTAKLYKRREK